MKTLLRAVAKNLKNLCCQQDVESKSMNKKNYRYTSGGRGKSLRLRELKELDWFCLMSMRSRKTIMTLKINLKKSTSQQLYKVFQYCFLHCEAQLYLVLAYISDSFMKLFS